MEHLGRRAGSVYVRGGNSIGASTEVGVVWK